MPAWQLLALSLALGLEMNRVEGFGLSHNVRNNLRAVRGPVMSVDRQAFYGEAFIERASWLVLFCGVHGAARCSDLRNELISFQTRGDKPLSDMQLAEVDCTRDEGLCEEQGFAAYPAAVVHYTKGQRRAVWEAHAEDNIDFAGWIWMNFKSHTYFSWTLEGAQDYICSVPQNALNRLLYSFPNLRRPEIAIAAAGILLVQIAVVAWVIMEGFRRDPSEKAD